MVRWSHLAEAITVGLGARQHASVVPSLQPDARGYDALMLGRDELFVGRLTELGYKDVAPGHFEAAFKGTVLPHSIYAAFKQGDRYNSHYHRCSRHRRPMMMVKMACIYAELEWDCITVHPGEEAGDQLANIMFNLFQARAKDAPGNPLFCGSAFTGIIKKFLPTTARQLAEDYFGLLYSPLLEPQAAIGTS